MFLPILTLTLCLTKALVYENFEDHSRSACSSTEPLYNVNEWVTKLQLEKCALVAVGLKFFAIFVEDDILESGKVVNHRKYFLGVCHQSTLEEWSFCSPGLSRKRKHKCRFKLNTNGYVARVHRRFCDMRILINNKDCNCEPTILGDEVVKVKGFPTCYMPPISSSLCKYNVCGLHKCRATTVEDRVYSVECSPKCRGGNPFCEYPIDRTSRFPVQRSFWSRWLEEGGGESTGTTGRKRFVATCINKYTGRGDLDCLGPGTGCCNTLNENCTCNTYEENGVLKVEKTVFTKNIEFLENKSFKPKILNRRMHRRKLYRYIRAPDEDDIEDDDEDDDLDEDILLEENTEEEDTITTTEELEKEEVEKQVSLEIKKELLNATKKGTVKNARNGAHGVFPDCLLTVTLLIDTIYCF